MNKEKKTYKVINNLVYNLSSTKKWNIKLFYSEIVYFLPTILTTYIGIYLPSIIVKGVTDNWNVKIFLIQIIALGGILLICNLISAGLYQYMYRNGMTLTMYYDRKCFNKIMSMPYEQIEQAEIKELINSVWNVLRSEYGIRNSVILFPDLITSLFEVILFGYLIGRQNFLLIAVSCSYLVISMMSLKKVKQKHALFHEELSSLSNQTSYISREIMDKSAAADIRIYKMEKWILSKYDHALNGIASIYNKIHNTYFSRSVYDEVIQYIVEGTAYIYLIFNVYNSRISIPEFVFLIGAFRQFIDSLRKLIDLFLTLIPTSTSIQYIREFINIPDVTINKEQLTINQIEKIELRNVSFSYPGSNIEIIKNLNLTINKEEKLALLGLNGAGKTTLIKLICGLYKPTKGEILINDISIINININSLNDSFSALFQDSVVLPMEIDRNIMGSEFMNQKKNFQKVLQYSDFWKKYEELPQRGKTLLINEVNKQAINLSGGEKQKLLFARALYKNANVVILDEPTSALDPLAENKMYERFAKATDGKTVIFISHRMASTRFCDRIVLIEKGSVIEEGTHESLMKEKGKYFQLYNLQSKYYKE